MKRNWQRLTKRRLSVNANGIVAGATAGLLLLLLWWGYQSVPRAPLVLMACVAGAALALLFRYPILGTCAFVVITSSYLMEALPSGFLLPLTALTSLFAVARRVMMRDPTVPIPPLVLGLILWAGIYALSSTWAPVYDHFDFMTIVRLFFLVLMIALTVDRPNHLVALIIASGIGLILSASVTIHNMLTFFSTGTLVETAAQHGLEKSRFFGLWPDPDLAGVTAVPIVALNYAIMRCRLPAVARITAGLAVMLGITAVVLSQTRSAGLFLAMVIAIFVIADKRRGLVLGITLGCALLVMSVVGLDFIGRMGTIGSGTKDASIAQRTEIAQGAIRMYEDHFPFGSGGGNNRTYSPDYNFSLLGGMVSHSGYLDVLSELGIVGLLVYLGAIVSVYPALRIARFRIEPGDLRQTLGVAMIAAFLTVFLALGIGSWSGWSYFWMVLAIISTREWAFASHESSQDSGSIGTVERRL